MKPSNLAQMNLTAPCGWSLRWWVEHPAKPLPALDDRITPKTKVVIDGTVYKTLKQASLLLKEPIAELQGRASRA